VGEDAINSIKKGQGVQTRELTDQERKEIQKIINEAIKALNMSATSVYDLANGGESYRECLLAISVNETYDQEFKDLYGIKSADAVKLVDEGVLNGAILDVIVQNSKQIESVLF
jgi:hypothetical protein